MFNLDDVLGSESDDDDFLLEDSEDDDDYGNSRSTDGQGTKIDNDSASILPKSSTSKDNDTGSFSSTDWSDVSDSELDTSFSFPGQSKAANSLTVKYSNMLKEIMDQEEEEEKFETQFDPRWALLHGISTDEEKKQQRNSSSISQASVEKDVSLALRDLRALLVSRSTDIYISDRLRGTEPLSGEYFEAYLSHVLVRLNLGRGKEAAVSFNALIDAVGKEAKGTVTCAGVAYALKLLRLALSMGLEECGNDGGLWPLLEARETDGAFLSFYKSSVKTFIESLSRCGEGSEKELDHLVPLLDACLEYNNEITEAQERLLANLQVEILVAIHEYLYGINPVYLFFIPWDMQEDFEAMAFQEFDPMDYSLTEYVPRTDLTKNLFDIPARLDYFSKRFSDGSGVDVFTRIKLGIYLCANNLLVSDRKAIEYALDLFRIDDPVVRGTSLFLQFEKIAVRIFAKFQMFAHIGGVLTKENMAFNADRDESYSSFLREIGDKLKKHGEWNLTLRVFEFLLNNELEHRNHQGTIFLLLTILQEVLYASGNFSKLLDISERVYSKVQNAMSTHLIRSKLYFAKVYSRSLSPQRSIGILRSIIKEIYDSTSPQNIAFKLEASLLAAKIYYKLRDIRRAKGFLELFQTFFIPKPQSSFEQTIADNSAYIMQSVKIHYREREYGSALFWISVLGETTSKNNLGRMARIKYLEGKILFKILKETYKYPVVFRFRLTRKKTLGFDIPESYRTEGFVTFSFRNLGQLLESTVKSFTNSLSYYGSLSSEYRVLKVKTRISEAILSYAFTSIVYYGEPPTKALQIAPEGSDLSKILNISTLLTRAVDNLNVCAKMKPPALTVENLLIYAKIQYLRGEITLSMKSWNEVKNTLYTYYISGLTEFKYKETPIKFSMKVFKLVECAVFVLLCYPWFFINDNLMMLDLYISMQRVVELKMFRNLSNNTAVHKDDEYWGLTQRLRRHLKRYKVGDKKHYELIRRLSEMNRSVTTNSRILKITKELQTRYEHAKKRKKWRKSIVTKKLDKMDSIQPDIVQLRKKYDQMSNEEGDKEVEVKNWWFSKGFSYDNLYYLNRSKATKLVFILLIRDFVIYYSPRLRRRMIVPITSDKVETNNKTYRRGFMNEQLSMISFLKAGDSSGLDEESADVSDGVVDSGVDHQKSFDDFFAAPERDNDGKDSPLLQEENRIFKRTSLRPAIRDFSSVMRKWIYCLVSHVPSKPMNKDDISELRESFGNPHMFSPSRYDPNHIERGNSVLGIFEKNSIKGKLGLGKKDSKKKKRSSVYSPSILLVLGKWLDILPWDALFMENALRYFSYFNILEDEVFLRKKYKTHSYFRYIGPESPTRKKVKRHTQIPMSKTLGKEQVRQTSVVRQSRNSTVSMRVRAGTIPGDEMRRMKEGNSVVRDAWIKDLLANLTISKLLNKTGAAEVPRAYINQLSKSYKMRDEYFVSPLNKAGFKPSKVLGPMDWNREHGDILIISFSDLAVGSWKLCKLLSVVGGNKPTLLVVPEDKVKLVAKYILKYYKKTRKRDGVFGMKWMQNVVSGIFKKVGRFHFVLVNPWFYP